MQGVQDSNAPIKPESQSILSKIVALAPSEGSLSESGVDIGASAHHRREHDPAPDICIGRTTRKSMSSIRPKVGALS
jgi:hypothetical protein